MKDKVFQQAIELLLSSDPQSEDKLAALLQEHAKTKLHLPRSGSKILNNNVPTTASPSTFSSPARSIPTLQSGEYEEEVEEGGVAPVLPEPSLPPQEQDPQAINGKESEVRKKEMSETQERDTQANGKQKIEDEASEGNDDDEPDVAALDDERDEEHDDKEDDEDTDDELFSAPIAGSKKRKLADNDAGDRAANLKRLRPSNISVREQKILHQLKDVEKRRAARFGTKSIST